MEVIGFHSTDISSGENIEKTGYKKSNPNAWLGDGVYFFSDYFTISKGYQEAIDWATKVKNFKSYVVFKATIISDTFIDIAFNEEHKQLFLKIKNSLMKKHEKNNYASSFKENVIFLEMAKNPKIDFILALVDPCKNSSYVIAKMQLQVCVKNTKSIVKNIKVD